MNPDDDPRLTIYQLGDLAEIEGLSEAVEELKRRSAIEVRKESVPAVLGELAGWAVDILVSESVQAIVTLGELGGMLWAVVRLARAAGRKIRIASHPAKALILARAMEDLKRELPPEATVWGPIAAEPTGELLDCCLKGYDGATFPLAYFMGVSVSSAGERSLTFWYVLSSGGDICASWRTEDTFKRDF